MKNRYYIGNLPFLLLDNNARADELSSSAGNLETNKKLEISSSELLIVTVLSTIYYYHDIEPFTKSKCDG